MILTTLSFCKIISLTKGLPLRDKHQHISAFFRLSALFFGEKFVILHPCSDEHDLLLLNSHSNRNLGRWINEQNNTLGAYALERKHPIKVLGGSEPEWDMAALALFSLRELNLTANAK